MQFKFLFSFLIFLGFNFYLVAQKTTAPLGYIRGKITDKSTGKNIANATVELLDNKKVVRTIDSYEDGTFILSEIPAGIYTLQCKAPNHVSQRIEGLQIKNKDEKLSYFRLRQGDEKAAPEVIATYATIQAKLNTQVSSASLYATSLFDAPANIYIFDKKDIEERGFMTLVELLETVPEIEIQERGSAEYRNLITLRGIQGSGHFLLLLDGVRINSQTGSDGIIDKNISIRYAQQVEIIVGTTSAIYGGEAVSGVVNIISDKSGKNCIQATGSIGAYGTTDNAIHGAYTQGDFSASVAASFYRTNEPFLPKYFKNDFDWYNNYYLKDSTLTQWIDLEVDTVNQDSAILIYDTLKVTDIQPFDIHRQAAYVQAQMKYKNFEIGFQRNQETFSSAFPSRDELALYNKNNRQGQYTSNFFIRQTWSALDSQLQFATVLNYSRQSKIKNLTPSFGNYSAGYDNSFEARQQISYAANKNHVFYGNLVFILSNSLGLIDGMPQIYNNQQSTTEQNLFYSGTGFADLNAPPIYYQTYYVDRTQIGSSLQYEGKVSKKLNIGVGFRYDDVTTTSSLRFREKALVPKLHLVWRVNPKWRLKLAYRQTFLPASIQKAFYHNNNFRPIFDSNGIFQNYELAYTRVINPRLRGEIGFVAEAMVSRAARNWQISLNNFVQGFDNQTVNTYQLNTVYNGYNSLVVEQPRNSSRTIILGTTIQIEYRPLFNQEKNFELKFNLSGSLIGGGVILENNSSLSAFAVGNLPFTSIRTFKAGTVLRYGRLNIFFYFSGRYRSFNQAIPQVTKQNYSPPYILANLFVKYRLIDKVNKLDIFLQVRNLLDLRYYNLAEAQVFNMDLVPQDPIRISGGVSATFGK